MPLAHISTLPRSIRPQFPDRCVRCGRERPGHTWRHGSRSVSLAVLYAPFSGRNVSVHVPACVECASKLTSERRLRAALLVALLVTGAAVGVYGIGDTDQGWRKALPFVSGIAFALPYLLLFVFKPSPFDMVVDAKEVVYRFADARYAEEFDEINAIRLSARSRRLPPRFQEPSR